MHIYHVVRPVPDTMGNIQEEVRLFNFEKFANVRTRVRHMRELNN